MTVQDVSHSQGPTDYPILNETIGANFRAIAQRFPDSNAVIEAATDRRFTYREMDEATDAIAKSLMALGLERGDRLGIWSPNCHEWAFLQYATAKAGVIMVNVNPAYRQHELNFVVKQNGMRALVVAPAETQSDYPAMARVAREEAEDLRDLIFLNNDAAAPLESAPSGEHDLAWGNFLSLGAYVSDEELAAREASLSPDDAINLQYTSGTTGFPKGATLTHKNLLNNGFHIGEILNYTENDVVVIAVPFFHCFGMVIGNIAALSHGSATVLPARGFKPDLALEAVQKYGGTSLYGVPTMFIAELALPNFKDYDLSTLRTGVMAGSTCPVEVMKRVISEMNMHEVAICYGMTETSPVSTMTRLDDSLERRTQTVGRAMPQLEIKIVDAEGNVVPIGAAGEMCTKGYSVMSGYWGEPDKTALAIDEDGWMHTGDLASMDEDGYLRIEGRIKDLIIRGGENISPREVEEFLYTHPDIQDVQIIGVPDEKYGEELMACVILKDGAQPVTAEALKDFCAGKIAHYKVPKYVQIRESFPMTISGKIRKIELRDEAAKELGLIKN